MTLARPVLTLILICVATLFIPREASATESLRVAKPQASVFDFVPLNIGVEKGIFARHGVKVHIVVLSGGAQQMQALTSDAVDLGIGSGPAMAFAARGAPVKGVAEMATKPSVMVLAVNAKGPVRTIADLKGRTLSISSRGSITEWLIRELEKQQGWSTNAIKLVGLGSNEAQMAALRTGQVAGLPTDIFLATKFERQGVVRILARFGNIVPHFIMHVIFANDHAIATKPDAIRRFLAGWFDTIRYMRTHKTTSVKIAARITRVPPKIISSLYGEIMPMFSTTGRFDQQGLDLLARSFVSLHLLPKRPDMKKLYTENYLPAAAD